MKRFTKTNIDDIPLEDAHGGSGQRKVLVKPEHVTSKHLEIMTKAFLNTGSSFDWHNHQGTDEMFIVLKGQGKFYCEDSSVTDYKENDIFSIQADVQHKISAEGNAPSEFFFVRVKV